MRLMTGKMPIHVLAGMMPATPDDSNTKGARRKAKHIQVYDYLLSGKLK